MKAGKRLSKALALATLILLSMPTLEAQPGGPGGRPPGGGFPGGNRPPGERQRPRGWNQDFHDGL